EMQMRFLALLALLLGPLGPWCSRNTSPPNTSPPNTPPAAGGPLIPPDRLTTWNPGIPGGVPSRTTVCATIDASTYDNGAKDAAAGIQAALEARPEGQVVVLSAGTFAISVPLQITKGIVLRGQGPSQTKILMPVGTNAPLGQVMEIQSVAGNTVNFTTPFHIGFQTAYAAQLSRFSRDENGPRASVVKYAGLEDLYVRGGSRGQGNVWLSNAAYSWIKNVE